MRDRPTRKAKWKEAEDIRLQALSNEELLEEVLSSAGGDDYDGCFTDRGHWRFNRAVELLKERLGDWLKK